MALGYLISYLGGMVSLVMSFLTTTVAVVISPIGLMLIIVLAAMTVLSLVKVTHPPAPPYPITLLFRQVRIRLGLSPNLNYVDEIDPKNNMVDDYLLLLTNNQSS